MYFQLEVTLMTRLSPSGSHLPINLHETSDEDRKTYRKWARASYVCYFFLVAGLLAVGLSTRQSGMQTAIEDRTGAIDNAKPAGQHHPGG
jgi:hypothetical protein